MNYLLEFWGLEFPGGKATKYANAIIEMRVRVAVEWPEQLKWVIRSNWLINPWDKSGKFLALDEFMEELVRAYKQQYNPGGSESLDDHMRKVVAKCGIYFRSFLPCAALSPLQTQQSLGSSRPGPTLAHSQGSYTTGRNQRDSGNPFSFPH